MKLLKWQHLISPRKWLHFIKGKILSKVLSIEYCELILFRANNPNCKSCIEAGHCLHCGCSMPAAMYVKDNECSAGHWEGFKPFNKEEWEEYKKLYDIQIKII